VRGVADDVHALTPSAAVARPALRREHARSMPRAYDTVLFDLDGTLIDSIELIRRSHAHTLRAHRGLELDEREWLAGLGRPLAWQFERFTGDRAEIDAMIATYREFNFAHHDAMVSPFPGAADALRELRRRGARLGVVTSKLRYGAERGLTHCGLRELIDVVVGSDEVARAKPDPEPVARALDALGSIPGRSVMVGDSPHDLASGRAAGTATAAVAWGPFPRAELLATSPDVWLERMADVAALA
jgi:pyrophosphatase PpaX